MLEDIFDNYAIMFGFWNDVYVLFSLSRPLQECTSLHGYIEKNNCAQKIKEMLNHTFVLAQRHRVIANIIFIKSNYNITSMYQYCLICGINFTVQIKSSKYGWSSEYHHQFLMIILQFYIKKSENNPQYYSDKFFDHLSHFFSHKPCFVPSNYFFFHLSILP